MKYVESITVSPSSKIIKLDTWYHKAEATVCPCDADKPTVCWYSDDECVATVNPTTGHIYGVSLGTARIYACACDGSGVQDYITVTVSRTVPVERITLNRSYISIEKDTSATLVASIFPEDATDKSLTWCSSNESVASVANGVVCGIRNGTATITATSSNGKSASCNVTVTGDILVSSITVIAPNKNMTVGESAYFTASVLPINATKKSVCWSSENSNIASVNPDSGLVYAKAVGTTTIYATACDGSGIEDCCQITVTPKIMVTSIEIDPSKKTMYVGDVCYCFLSIASPSTATDRRVRWTSNDCNIAYVDSVTGVVTAKAAGTTFIYANAIDGSGVSGRCEVTVKTANVTGISLNKSSYTFDEVGKSTYLSAKVIPNNATNKSVVWSSSNDRVVSVTQNGRITAVSTNGKLVDSAVISAKTSDGGFVSSCTVYVDTRETVTVETDPAGSYSRIVFSNGKVWNCINTDLINAYNLDIEDPFSQRFYDNTYQNKVIDETELVYYGLPMKEYTDDEIKLIYTVDPYGLAAYVKEYAKHNHEVGCSVQEMLEGTLEYKDRIFELLYKRKPQYYKRNSPGNWVVTSERSNLSAKVSESEYLFGFHNLLDKTTTYEILSIALDLLSSMVSSTINPLLGDFISDIGSICLNLWAGKAPFNLQDIAQSIVGDEIPNEISSWATYISLQSSLQELQELLSDRPQVYSQMLDFSSDINNHDINYNIVFKLRNGNIYSARNLHDMM